MTTTSTTTLHHTDTGGRLHLLQCPHLVSASPIHQAVPTDPRPVCQWSQNELAGVGRTYHDSVEAALEDMGAAQHARPELTRLLNAVSYDEVFVPHSRSYVTVLLKGCPEAWAGKSYVTYRNGTTVELPGFVARGDGAGLPGNGEGAWGQTCNDCFQKRSLSGHCGCDD